MLLSRWREHSCSDGENQLLDSAELPNVAKPIVVIGSLNMDLAAQCETLPRSGQTVFGQDFFTAAGGKGANQAIAAARLGAQVTMAGCVGADAFGRDLIAGLRAAGVATDAIRVVDVATGTALITIDRAGANTIVVISGANAACDTASVDDVLALANGPGILLLQHEIPQETNEHAIRAARDGGWFIVLNPAPARPVAPELLPLVDMVVPNETEAAAITGLVVDSRKDALAAAHNILARGARAALMTLGVQGALYCGAAGTWHCPAVPVKAVDSTAAGDAYIGALATALAAGRSVPDGMSFAAAAAALSVTRLGAQKSLGTRDEVANFIAHHGAPVPKAIAS
jgi:ribokinase